MTEAATGYANTNGYNANLDVLRSLAVVAIVWIHSVETQTFKADIRFCRFAVPAFTATSVLLLLLRHGNDSAKELGSYVTRRATKLYLLFLAWNCIYAAIRVAEHGVVKGGDAIRWSRETFLLAGFTEQLWFLPFLAVVTILAAAPAFVIARMGSKSRVLIMFLLFSGIIVALLPSPIKIDLETHPASYWFALSWGALASALMVFSIIPFCKHVKLSLLAVMLAFFAWMLLWLPVGAECTNLLQNVSGVILILCAFLAPSLVSFKGAFRQLGELALPVYLLHPLFVHAVQAVGHRLAHLPVSVGFDVVVLFGGLVGSGLSAWYLQRIPPLKSLVMLR